jgi:hypothetical protein
MGEGEVVLEIFFWLCVAYILISFGEYIPHRWAMHAKFFCNLLPIRAVLNVYERHAIFHHGRFYKNFEHDADPIAKHVNIEMEPFMHLCLSAPVWIPLFWIAPIGAVVLPLCIFIHGFLWSAIHFEMHEPSGSWWTKNAVFRFWRNYHYVHHKHVNTNFNVICPLADFLFCTYRRQE